MYVIDGINRKSEDLIKKGIIKSEFDDKDEAWDYVDFVMQQHPGTDFVVIEREAVHE